MGRAPERAALSALDRRVVAAECEIVRLRALAEALAQIGMAEAAAQVRRRIAGLREAADAAEATRRAVLGAGPIGH